MNPHGRQADEKMWDTTFRHSFYTNYITDPDIHTLMFMAGPATNEMIREALRDWMLKTKSRAIDPEFRKGLFVAALSKAALGQRAVASELMAELGETANTAPRSKPRQPAQRKPANSTSVSKAQPTPSVQVVELDEVSEQVPEQMPVPPTRPAVLLDFGTGPEPELAGSAPEEQKVSERQRWLARHR